VNNPCKKTKSIQDRKAGNPEPMMIPNIPSSETRTTNALIRILVVEDSPVSRDFLTHILNLVPDLQVVGVAHNGEEAIKMVRDSRPDVITMDIHMPGMDGFETTLRIMETHATPIVVVSGSSSVTEAVTAFRALSAGALAVMPRPYGFGHPEFASSTTQLVETLRLMAGVKVVRRWPKQGIGATEILPNPSVPSKSVVRMVAIGSSTGGPAALATILGTLPKNMPCPILIVQHICDGFVQGFVEWLAQTSELPVHVGTNGETPLPGHVYVAPDGFHMEVNGAHRIKLDAAPPLNGLRPSVAHLFRSVAAGFGSHAIAILLTGMGTDGAAELKLIRDRGGVTIAQDQASSVVHGMPGEAIRLGAAMHVLSPDAIGALLRRLA
jgi:two-component system chemotaxis response regulator CheB